MRITRSVLVMVFASGIASQAQAQMNPTSNQCASAASAVAGRPLPSLQDTTRSWYWLAACGAVGHSAFAGALQTAVVLGEQDSLRVVELFGLFRARKDATLFSALRSTVQNTSASGPVRSEAIASLGSMYAPHMNFLPSYFLRTNPAPASCASFVAPNVESGDAASLPSDFLQQIVAAMRNAEADAAATASVRGAARCWRIFLESAIPPVGTNLKLTYICGNRFRVRNTNTAPALVTTDVYGTPETHRFTVVPGVDYYFGNNRTGTVRLFLNGQLVQVKANGSKPCTP